MGLFKLPNIEIFGAKKQRLKEEERQLKQRFELLQRASDIEFDHERKMLELRTTAQKQQQDEMRNELQGRLASTLTGEGQEDFPAVFARGLRGEETEVAPAVKTTASTAPYKAEMLMRRAESAPIFEAAGARDRAEGRLPLEREVGRTSASSQIALNKFNEYKAEQDTNILKMFEAMDGPSAAAAADVARSRANTSEDLNRVKVAERVKYLVGDVAEQEMMGKLKGLEFWNSEKGQDIMKTSYEQAWEESKLALSMAKARQPGFENLAKYVGDEEFVKRVMAGDRDALAMTLVAVSGGQPNADMLRVLESGELFRRRGGGSDSGSGGQEGKPSRTTAGSIDAFAPPPGGSWQIGSTSLSPYGVSYSPTPQPGNR